MSFAPDRVLDILEVIKAGIHVVAHFALRDCVEKWFLLCFNLERFKVHVREPGVWFGAYRPGFVFSSIAWVCSESTKKTSSFILQHILKTLKSSFELSIMK